MLRAALAVRLFQVEFQDDPEGWEDLAEDELYFATAPEDPMAAEPTPIGFVVSDDEIVLSSVGDRGSDADGLTVRIPRRQAATPIQAPAAP